MIDSTIQKWGYSFCEDYTDVKIPIYENMALQELDGPVKRRLYSLDERDTRDSKDEELYNNEIELLLQKKQGNKLDYICQSTEWIGYVLEIKDDSFTAKLIDVDDNTTYEIAEFDKIDVSACDMDLLALGAVFYWSVGYANHFGQIIKQSFIRFKRSINLDVKEFDSIIDNARKLNDEILWE
jgi:hypothetical protein